MRLAQPATETLTSPPESFPQGIPIYDPDAITSIEYTPASQSNRGLSFLGYIPKLIFSPLIVALDLDGIHDADASYQDASFWQRVSHIVYTPLTDEQHRVVITWKQLSAAPDFVREFYETELLKQYITIFDITTTPEQMSFSFERNGLSGDLHITDIPDAPGTEYAILNVRFSNDPRSSTTHVLEAM